MANLLYPKFKQALLQGNVDLDTAVVKAILVDGADYSYNAAHEFLSDVAAGAREETSAALTVTFPADGAVDLTDASFPGTAGDACELVILYIDTGVEGTSRLIGIWDTITGLPVTLGPDVTLVWGGAPNYVFKL